MSLWTYKKLQYTINWPQASFLLTTPVIALWTILFVPLQRATAAFTIFWYFGTAFGITAGYHRLWAHKSYQATFLYRLALAVLGAGAVEGSIRWWSRGHRAHHRFTDSDLDPYSAHRGLFWSHIGWMLVKVNGKKSTALGKVEMSDLDRDPLVRWQHRWYLPLAMTFAFIIPTLVAGLGWNDWRGGLFWVGITRLVFVHHATFFVNSLAHYLGETTFDDVRSPRDHFVTALLTCGEGYHNFHHEYPNDYRNAIQWYQYDPTKWFIRTCSILGLTYHLKRFPENEVQKGMLVMKEKQLAKWRLRLDWGVPLSDLPSWDSERFEQELKLNRFLLIIEDIVYDVSKFIHEHPGGVGWINAYLGKDATQQFNGGVYQHANAARNLMQKLRVAHILYDCASSGEDSATTLPNCTKHVQAQDQAICILCNK